MPDKINLDSSGLRRSARLAVLSWREKVYSHSATVLKSVKRSLKHACLVLFLSFCAIGAALNGGVHSHQVLAQSSSTPKQRSLKKSARVPFATFRSNLSSGMNCWVHSYMGCEPVTSTRGLCHGKKSEQAGCIASAQTHGLCHGKKSE